MTMRAFTKTEQEIVILRAVWDLIDGMVNYANFVGGHEITNTHLMFRTATHQTLFNILLRDFLSLPARDGLFQLPQPSGSKRTDRTYLFYLYAICDDPNLNETSDGLRCPVETFSRWLECEYRVEKVWFPSIQVERDIQTNRILPLQICGDVAKHNFSRLHRRVRDIETLLKENGVTIQPGQGYLILSEFHDWFHNHVLNYQSTSIAQHLNDIRWGIFEYLQSEFARSFKKSEPYAGSCRFTVPAECRDPVVQAIYWDLMNSVRRKPYFPRFTTDPHVQRRF